MQLNVEFTGSSTTGLHFQDDLQQLTTDDDITSVTIEDASDSVDNITGGEVALVAAIVYVAPIAAQHVVDIFYKIRKRFRPLAVLDLTDDEPKMTVMEDAPGHGGELIIKTKEGEEANFIDGPEVPRGELLDFVKEYLPK